MALTLLRDPSHIQLKGMTLSDFYRLNDLDKEVLLDLKGVVITDRLENRTQIVIYQIDDFYVEVQYDIIASSVRRFKGCTRTYSA